MPLPQDMRNGFTGYLNWEVFEKLREKTGAPVQQAAE